MLPDVRLGAHPLNLESRAPFDPKPNRSSDLGDQFSSGLPAVKLPQKRLEAFEAFVTVAHLMIPNA